MPASDPFPPVEIRVATQDDVPVILAFIRGLAEYERLSQHVVATEESIAKSMFGQRPAAEAILAFAPLENPAHPPQAVGFALFFENFSTFAGRRGMYLEDLFVMPEARGRGIGKSLFRELARISVEREYCRLDWAVLDWNEPAIKFYRSIGAEVMDEWTINRLTGRSLLALAGSR